MAAEGAGVTRVGPGRVEVRNGDTTVSSVVEVGGGLQGGHELVVTIRGYGLEVPPPLLGDGLLTMSLIAAMHHGQELEVADPVSPELLENLVEVQGILHSWYPALPVVKIRATPHSAGGSRREFVAPRRKAHFFSGGVDSLHSVGQSAASLDALVFIDGSDVRHASVALRGATVERLGRAAARWDLPLVHVESNVGLWAMACGRHSDDFLGARLAMVAHFMGTAVDEWVIAPSVTSRCKPFPSHPVLDPHWSSGRVKITHPVPHRSRAEKVWELAADSRGLLGDLRVCMLGEHYNCGVCRKCSRTLLCLKVLGLADRAPVFAENPEVPEILQELAATPHALTEIIYLEDLITLAQRTAVPADLIGQLEAARRKMKARIAWEHIEESGEEVFDLRHWEKTPFALRRACFRALLRRNPEWILKELASSLPQERESVFACLWKKDRNWLKKRVRRASFERLLKRLGSTIGGSVGNPATRRVRKPSGDDRSRSTAP